MHLTNEGNQLFVALCIHRQQSALQPMFSSFTPVGKFSAAVTEELDKAQVIHNGKEYCSFPGSLLCPFPSPTVLGSNSSDFKLNAPMRKSPAVVPSNCIIFLCFRRVF